jgi:hypothetical protein
VALRAHWPVCARARLGLREFYIAPGVRAVYDGSAKGGDQLLVIYDIEIDSIDVPPVFPDHVTRMGSSMP